MSDLSTILKSFLAESLTNVSSSNPNTPSQHVRKEGWTEVFGNKEMEISKKAKEVESKSQSAIAASATNVQIMQYRTDWASQLVLRMYSIPHMVINTPYLSNQATGAYPQYKNLSGQTIIGNTGITSHLFEKYNVDSNIGTDMNTEERMIHSEIQCITSLIQELNLILKALRYGDDEAWESIYRKQCIQASILHNHPKATSEIYHKHLHGHGDESSKTSKTTTADGFFHAYAWFQAWAERSVNLKESKVGNYLHHRHSFLWDKATKELNKDVAIQMASERYKSLDAKLMKMNTEGTGKGASTSVGPNFLSFYPKENGSSSHLTSADVLLFSHLAEALCDVNLIGVLAECKNLVLFFQNVYEKYFGKEYQTQMMKKKNANGVDISWIKTNNTQNALNQFNRLPLNELLVTQKVSTGGYQDAIKIMQSVAMHCHDLQEVLADVALQKKKQDDTYGTESNPQKKKAGWMLHFLRMGGELDTKGRRNEEEDSDDDDDEDATGTSKKYKEQMKKMLRENKKNDELWMSGVLCATVIAILAAQGRSDD